MKCGAGLLILVLCVSLNVDGTLAGDGSKGRDRNPPPESRPAAAVQGIDDDSAMRQPGWGRDWWPRRDGRGRDQTSVGAGERWRGKQGLGGPAWDDEGEQMSPEQISKLMEFTQRNFPQLHQRLVAVRDTNPMMFRHMIRRVGGPVAEIMRVQQQNPEAARKLIEAHRIEIDLTELRGQYQAARGSQQREQLKTRMRELLAKRCELRLERLQKEVGDLEKRLEETKKEIAKREKDKDQIIEQEMKRLLSGGPAPPGADLLPPPPGGGPKGGRRGQGPPPPVEDAPSPVE